MSALTQCVCVEGVEIREEAASAAAETIATQLLIQLKLNTGTQELSTDGDWCHKCMHIAHDV